MDDKNGGLKYDSGKPDLTYISLELLVGLAKVREFGDKKYTTPQAVGRDNWKKGFKFTKSLTAALRHIEQFLHREDFDKESKILHLYHAVASIEHCIYDYIYHPYNDDRGPASTEIDDILKRVTQKTMIGGSNETTI